MKSTFWLYYQYIVTLVLVVAITSIKADDSCSPINCLTSCASSCSADQVCVVGTMTTCGICPQSKCVPRESLGLSSTGQSITSTNGDSGTHGSSTASSDDTNDDPTVSSTNNGALIGGIVGGLLGGGTLLCLLSYLIFIRPKRNQRKSNMPLHLRPPTIKPTNNNTAEPTVRDEEEMYQHSQHTSLSNNIYSSSGRQQQMSGVIPVTFIPPMTYSNRTTTSLSRFSALNALHQSILNDGNHDDDQANPFHDRQSIVTTTTMSTDTQFAPNQYNPTRISKNRHMSIESDMSSSTIHRSSIAVATSTTTIATIAQAMQVMRAKPQVMRVNTLNSNSATRKVSIKRTSSSEKVVEEHEQQQQDDEMNDNPFDDKNKVTSKTLTSTAALNHTSTSRQQQYFSGVESSKATTDSVLSCPGDGEITIIWNAN
ncbi:hypothetical protein BDF20DRAFT_149181 [Mycotypha africana]|uniref:uncharacterized protein n=1 Tax=Mycotypha africana TaxID=64632 RepID=UPI002300946D|nr:uncharacterized protein BDF20DRAFT_149181 [Mycotypha africana]KAI8969170.1 hypothetical protein BDF20DRAFT_149181 [Mycotypha africana]